MRKVVVYTIINNFQMGLSLGVAAPFFIIDKLTLWR